MSNRVVWLPQHPEQARSNDEDCDNGCSLANAMTISSECRYDGDDPDDLVSREEEFTSNAKRCSRIATA